MSWSETIAQAILQLFVAPEQPPAPVNHEPPKDLRMEAALDRLKNPPRPMYLDLLPEQESNMDPVTIIALISAILPLIQKCREDSNPTDEELLSTARGAQGVFAIRKGLRAQGFRGRRFRTATRQAVSELNNMSDTELLEQVINAPEMEKDDEGNDGVDYALFG